MNGIMHCDATFSRCRTWRCTLERKWGYGSTLVVVGLNPSTADEATDDPTIRRCIDFAQRWGYGGLVMLNLYAYRATDPQELKPLANLDKVGPLNDQHLTVCSLGRDVLAAWGNNADRDRASYVAHLLKSHAQKLMCLKVTKAGQPGHPLYIKADKKPFEFVPYP